MKRTKKKPRFANEAVGHAVTVLMMPQKPLTEHLRRKIEVLRKKLSPGEVVRVTKTGKAEIVKTSWAGDNALIAAKREALEEAAREADTFTSSADPDVVARWLRKRAKGVRA